MMNRKNKTCRKDAAAFIESLISIVSERLPLLISSIYGLLFKPFEFIAAIVRRDKAYFGIKSPSVEFARACGGIVYGFVLGIQEAKLKEIERVFAPYEIKGTICAPEYKPLADVVRDFNYWKNVYEWYND